MPPHLHNAVLPALEKSVIPGYVRTQSVLRAAVGLAGRRSGPTRVHEAGALRLRFPKVGGACEGIIVNTSGGIAGGDRQTISFLVGADAKAAITTQSAEKVYRSDGDIAHVEASLTLEPGSTLAWLPQETILFDTARLLRRINITMATDAVLTLKEGLVFGRTAMGEHLCSGLIHDRWRIRRTGRLILAEDVRLDGDIGATLARAAGGRGARAITTILHVAPDAASRLDGVRAALNDCADEKLAAGASAWDGLMLVRLAGSQPHLVREASAQVLNRLLPDNSPRIWSC
jgi:urease accessory protein